MIIEIDYRFQSSSRSSVISALLEKCIN